MNTFPIASSNPGAIKLLGIQIHPVEIGEVHAFIGAVITRQTKALVLNVNINCMNLTFRNPWLKELLNEAQLVFCDGDGVRWGAKLLGLRVPPKITYDRWIWQLAEFCEKNKFRIFFLGGRPGVAGAAADRLKGRYPSLEIAGVQDGYFAKEGEENEKVIEAINRVRPDILVVGFGMPLQEKWLSQNWLRLDARVFLTGGAVFDYVSGRARRAPQWMIQNHLEWLFRWLQEPRRLFSRYALGIPSFFFRILLERLKGPTK